MKYEFIKKVLKEPYFYDALGDFKLWKVISILLKYNIIFFVIWLAMSFFQNKLNITFNQIQKLDFHYILEYYIYHLNYVLKYISFDNVVSNQIQFYHYMILVPIFFTIIYTIISVFMYMSSLNQKKLAKVSLESYRLTERSKDKIVLRPKKFEEINYDYFEKIFDDFKQVFRLNDDWTYDRLKKDKIIIEKKQEINNILFSYENFKKNKFYLGKFISKDNIINDFFLNIDSMLHVAILGTSGVGKSNLLNLLIINFFYNFEKINKFVFVDFKGGLEAEPYKKIAEKFKLENKIITIKNDLDVLLTTLRNIDKLNKERAEILRNKGLKKWSNEYIYLIFDEFAALLTAEYQLKEEKEKQKEVVSIINNLFMTARSQNIRIIYVAQSYVKESSGINNTIKSNTTTKFMFNTLESTSISSVINHEELKNHGVCPEKLSDGEALYISNEIIRFKSPFVSDDIFNLTSKTFKYSQMTELDKLIEEEYQDRLNFQNKSIFQKIYYCLNNLMKMFLYSFVIIFVIFLIIFILNYF